MNMRDARILATLIPAVDRGARLFYLTPSERRVTVVLRSFTDANGNHLHGDDDILAGYVWTSGLFESFTPVRDALDALQSGQWRISND